MIVLDTHAWYWWTTEDRRLSRVARSRLTRETEVLVPSICLWEIAMLSAAARIKVGDVTQFLESALDWEGVAVADVSPAVAVRAAQIAKGLRLDPADQLIAATALEHRAPLVTRDERLRAIPGLRSVW